MRHIALDEAILPVSACEIELLTQSGQIMTSLENGVFPGNFKTGHKTKQKDNLLNGRRYFQMI